MKNISKSKTGYEVEIAKQKTIQSRKAKKCCTEFPPIDPARVAARINVFNH